MLVAVAGMSHRSAPVEVRESVAFPPCAGRGFLRRLREEGVAAEAVLISTCNRTEVYAVVEDEGARARVLDLLAEDRGVDRAALDEGHLLAHGRRRRCGTSTGWRRLWTRWSWGRARSSARSARRTGRRPRSGAPATY